MSIRVCRSAVAFCVAACVVALGLQSRSHAAINLFWTGGNSNQYGDGQNWSYYEGTNVPPAFAIPGTGNFAVFEKGAAISFSDFAPSQPPTSGNLQILNGAVSFTLGPIHFQDAVARTFTTNQLYVVAPFEDSNFLQQYNAPNGVNGSLFVSGGTLVVNGSTVIGGGDARNVGTLTLQASFLETTADVSVSQSSHGILNIGAASLVTSTGGNVNIGSQFGSHGTAIVSGGSAWLLSGSAPLTVGVQGTGSLIVTSGSLVSGVTLNIGSSNGAASASVTIDGAGSQLSFTHLDVGSVGDGTLTIQNGGSAISGDSSNHTTIGEFEGRTGAATVTGPGSSWITNGLAVGGGNTGHGSLVISGGGSVTSTDYITNVNGTPTVTSSSIGGGQGSVQVTNIGSTWTLAGGLSVSPYGNSNASLTIGSGGTVNVATTLQVNRGGTVQVDGTLNAATIAIDGGNVTQSGTVNISDNGTHIGVLSIHNGGSYTGAPTLGIPTPGHTDAIGQAYVRDFGSTWTIPGPYFLGAGGGLGTANVTFGGQVHSGDLGIGEITAGQLQVQGFGAAWSSTGTISVGNAGSIDVNNNGAVSASTLNVNANGTVKAKFYGSLQAANLNINGGYLEVFAATLTSTSTTVASGLMQMTNPTWNNSGTLYVGGNGSSASGLTAIVSINSGTATIGSTLKIWPRGQVTIDSNASVNVKDVDIQGGSLDVLLGQVNGSGYSLNVAAHGEYAQTFGDFNGTAFPSVTVNGALFNIQNGSINLGASQSLVATNGAIVNAVNGSLNIGSGASVSVTDSTVNAANVYVAGGLTLSHAAISIQSVNLDGGTIAAVTPLQIDSSLHGHGTINGDIQLAGGDIAANGGSLAVNGNISGFGALIGNVTAVSLTPTGDFTISGNHNDLGSQTAVLLSLHAARLDGTLNSNGGTVTSASGIAVTANGAINGKITIQGNVRNEGQIDAEGTINGNILLVGGSVAANGGSLAVTGGISGYGVLVGNVAAASLTPTGDLTISGSDNDLGSQTAVLLSLHPARLDGPLFSVGGTVTCAAGIRITADGAIIGNIKIHGNLTNDGLLDVGGNAIGLDTIYGNLVLDDTGIVRVQIGGTDPSAYDHIKVKNGNVTLGGTLDLVFINGFLPMQGDAFNIFIDDFSGSFSHLQVDGLGSWDYSIDGGSSGVTLNSHSDAVALPEPSSFALLALCAPSLWLAWRRRVAQGKS